ncbi:hypothetical protein ACFW04_010780 [Cataglyphis niger]
MIVEKSESNSDKVDFDQIIRNIFGMENVHPMTTSKNWVSIGYRSLVYMEIKQILEKDYNIILSFQQIHALTIEKLKNLLTR